MDHILGESFYLWLCLTRFNSAEEGSRRRQVHLLKGESNR